MLHMLGLIRGKMCLLENVFVSGMTVLYSAATCCSKTNTTTYEHDAVGSDKSIVYMCRSDVTKQA